MSSHPDSNQQILHRVLTRQIQSLQSALERIDADTFDRIVRQIVACEGRLILTGLGKMGAVARKAAATFASTGSPALFVHPSEALHGDLGMITRRDVVMALSYSGETDEVIQVLETLQPWRIPIIALTSRSESALGRLSDVQLPIDVPQEATDLVAIPSCSTTLTMALCDALAVAAMEQRGFSAEDFSIFHPAGALGRRLRTTVADVMRMGDRVPLIRPDQTLRQAIVEVGAKGVGATLVQSADGRLLGILTDGDIRRILEKHGNPLDTQVEQWMSAAPKSCSDNILAAKALRMMEEFRITVLPVTCDSGEILGVVHLHDLIGARIT